MNLPEHYLDDLLLFFGRRPGTLALYEALLRRLDAAFPGASLKIQKTQISFYGRHLFAAVSLPRRKRPEPCLLVTAGLDHPLSSPRVLASAEPYPGRWTHHIEICCEEELAEELLGWLNEAGAFSERKR